MRKERLETYRGTKHFGDSRKQEKSAERENSAIKSCKTGKKAGQKILAGFQTFKTPARKRLDLPLICSKLNHF